MDSDNNDSPFNPSKNGNLDMSLDNSQMYLNKDVNESTQSRNNTKGFLEVYEPESPETNIFKKELKPLGEKRFQLKKKSLEEFEAETEDKLIMENIVLGKSDTNIKDRSSNNYIAQTPGLRKSSDYDSNSQISEEDYKTDFDKDDSFEETRNSDIFSNSTSPNKQAQSKISIRKFSGSSNKLNTSLQKYKDDHRISEADEYEESDHDDKMDKSYRHNEKL